MEGVNVTVIVDGFDVIGFFMKFIKGIVVADVCGSSLVGYVDGMVEGKVSDGEGFVFCVAGFDVMEVVEIDLSEAGGHFTGVGSCARDDDEVFGEGDVVVFAVAFGGEDGVEFLRIPGNEKSAIDFKSFGLHGVDEGNDGGVWSRWVHHGDDDTGLLEDGRDLVDGCYDGVDVGDGFVGELAVGDDVESVDAKEDVGLVVELGENLLFGIGDEAGEDATGMWIGEEVASDFEVESAGKLGHTVEDCLFLEGDIFSTVKSGCREVDDILLIERSRHGEGNGDKVD